MVHSAPATVRAAIHRELHLFALYRVFEAALLCLVVFSPVAGILGEPRHPWLAGWVATGYLAAACFLFALRKRGGVRLQALAGIGVDIVASALAVHALPTAASGVAMMLLFNVGAAGLMLPLRIGLPVAALAAAALCTEYTWALLADGSEVTADDAYLAESIRSPDAKIVEGYATGTMPAYETMLNEGQVDAIVAYIRALQGARP